MNYEIQNRRIDDLRDALIQIEQENHETARPLFGRSSTRNRVHADGTNKEDLLIAKGDLVISIRQPKNTSVHIESGSDSITVNVSCLDSVEPQPTHHPQPSSKNSDGNAVDKEKVQNGDGVKDRIWGLIGKVHVVVQTVSNSIKIWEIFQTVPLIGLGMFGGS